MLRPSDATRRKVGLATIPITPYKRYVPAIYLTRSRRQVEVVMFRAK